MPGAHRKRGKQINACPRFIRQSLSDDVSPAIIPVIISIIPIIISVAVTVIPSPVINDSAREWPNNYRGRIIINRRRSIVIAGLKVVIVKKRYPDIDSEEGRHGSAGSQQNQYKSQKQSFHTYCTPFFLE
jgi:hypothetical protein